MKFLDIGEGITREKQNTSLLHFVPAFLSLIVCAPNSTLQTSLFYILPKSPTRWRSRLLSSQMTSLTSNNNNDATLHNLNASPMFVMGALKLQGSSPLTWLMNVNNISLALLHISETVHNSPKTKEAFKWYVKSLIGAFTMVHSTANLPLSTLLARNSTLHSMPIQIPIHFINNF